MGHDIYVEKTNPRPQKRTLSAVSRDSINFVGHKLSQFMT